MSTIVDKAVAALRKLPEDRQTEIAEVVLAAAETPEILTSAEKVALEDGLADANAGRFASDAEVKTAFDRLRTA